MSASCPFVRGIAGDFRFTTEHTLGYMQDQDRIWRFFQGQGVRSFEGSAARLGYLARLIDREVRRRPARVLNVGIGDGTLEQILKHLGHEVQSVDPDGDALARARERGLSGRVGRIEALPYPDAVFDVAVVSEVLEHLSDESLRSAVRELARVSTPDALLVGTVPYLENLDDNVVACPSCGEVFHRWGHQQCFSADRLAECLAERFRPIRLRVRHFGSWRHLNWKGRLVLLAKRLLNAAGVVGSGNTLVFTMRRLP